MIKIICVGSIKEEFFRDAIEEYKKRLTRYTKIEIIEVKDISYDDIDKSINLEGIDVLKHIDSKDYVITLEIQGKELSSEEIAAKIESIQSINPNIAFIIGGSYGLSNSVKERSDFRLSFSKMTFPHQLFRIILLEQIYRSFKILNNESYHK